MISVVIPLYNKARYIRRALDSVLAQTLADFEVVVVDDGSSDGGGEIAARSGDVRVRVVSQANAGVSAARNRGIQESAGGIVAFLDADDEWDPDFLACVAQSARLFPEAGLYATGYRCLFSRRLVREVTVADGRSRDRPFLVPHYFTETRRAAVVTSSSAAVPKRVLTEVGGFPVGERYGEDRDLWGRIALRYPVCFQPRILATYHCEAQGRSMMDGRDTTAPPPFILTAEQALRAEGMSPERAAEVRGYLDWLRVWQAERLVAARKRHEALQVLDQVLAGDGSHARAQVLRLALRHLPIGLVDSLLRLSHSRIQRLLSFRRSGGVVVRYTRNAS